MISEFCVAISTMGSRIDNLVLPERRESVSYLIVHQSENDACWVNANIRSDVIYIRVNEYGLSKSRNLALANCHAKYLYIMDDDVAFDLDRIKELVERMCLDGVDVATCRYEYHDGSSPKKYRSAPFTHGFLSAARVSSIEICVNVNSVRSKGLQFDETFGLGTQMPSGEEFIFITDCVKMKLKVRYYPISTGAHPYVTSGGDFYTNYRKIYAKREMFKRVFGGWSLFFIFLFWLKKIPIALKKGYGWRFSKGLLMGWE